MRKEFRFLIQLFFGIVLLFVWLRFIEWDLLLSYLRQVDLRFVGLMSILGMVGWIFRVLRFKIVLKPLVVIAASLPTVMLDKAFDLAAVLALGAAGALLGVPLDDRLSLVILAGGALLLGFVAFVGVAIRGRSGLLTVLAEILPRRLGDSLRGRIVETGEAFLFGFSTAAQRPRDLALMVLLSLVAIIVDATGFYLVFLSLGPPATFAVIATGFALLTLTYVIPGAPGYIGSTEAFGSLVFTSLGIGTELAASAVLLNHALMSVVIVSLGGVGLDIHLPAGVGSGYRRLPAGGGACAWESGSVPSVGRTLVWSQTRPRPGHPDPESSPLVPPGRCQPAPVHRQRLPGDRRVRSG